MATFGNIGYGAAGDYEPGTSPRGYLGSFVLSEDGDLTSAVARLQSASGTIDAKILVYQNNGSGGGPGTFLGATQETSVTTTAGNFTFTFATPLSLAAGTYWIGSIAESGSVRLFYENETGTIKITENLTYSSPENSPSIAATYTNENACIVITYTPSGGGASAVVWGEESPSEGSAESWTTWKTAAGGDAVVNGDADWGKLDLTNSNHYGPVKDTGNSRGKRFVVKRDSFGEGLGTVNIFIRGSTDSFLANAETPSWELYSAPINRVWRYVQLKTEKV